MTQPFRKGATFRSSLWQGLTIEYCSDHLLIHGAGKLDCISNAVYNGGMFGADHWVNWKVPLGYHCGTPEVDAARQLAGWEYPAASTIAMLTAAKLTHASVVDEEGDRFCALVCTTAGTRNAARAGSPRELYPSYTAGTLNTMLFVDGRMTPSAMVNALLTVTEAKSAALADLNIFDSETGVIATGTTTDAVMLAVSQSGRYGQLHQYAGTATTIGHTLSSIVYQSVYEAVATQHES